MKGLDWRSLYAANQEAIARAGVGRTARRGPAGRWAPQSSASRPGGLRVHVPAGLDPGRPAALVLIDFPEFNLRLARVARRAGIPVAYFIPPITKATVARCGVIGGVQRCSNAVIQSNNAEVPTCPVPF